MAYAMESDVDPQQVMAATRVPLNNEALDKMQGMLNDAGIQLLDMARLAEAADDESAIVVCTAVEGMSRHAFRLIDSVLYALGGCAMGYFDRDYQIDANKGTQEGGAV